MSEIWSLDNNGIRAAFLTREDELKGYTVRSVTNLATHSDEVQALEHNREVVSEYFTIPDVRLCMGKQVHGTNVSYSSKAGIIDKSDALVTDMTGLALAVLVADCAALLVADPVNKVIAAVHAGWRGAIGGIVPVAVNKMITLGAKPDVMKAYISSCISMDVFEVGEEVASRFPDSFVDRSKTKPHIDLRGYIRYELSKTGIPEDGLVIDDRCTVRTPKTLHSYRRDGDKSGRMMAVITIQ